MIKLISNLYRNKCYENWGKKNIFQKALKPLDIKMAIFFFFFTIKDKGIYIKQDWLVAKDFQQN